MTAHQTAQTSIDAYYALGPKLSRQQAEIIAFLGKHCHRDHTRGEIAEATGMRLSSVTGRVNELLHRFVLNEGPRRPCRVTGINAHPLRLAPAQMDLL